MLNLVLKQIKGSGKGLDPIDISLTLAGANEEGGGKSFPTRLGLGATDVAGELPFSSLFTGNFPTATAFTQPVKDAIAGNLFKAGEGVAADFLSPIGGGLQVKKTAEGIAAYNRGFATSAKG